MCQIIQSFFGDKISISPLKIDFIVILVFNHDLCGGCFILIKTKLFEFYLQKNKRLKPLKIKGLAV